MKKTPPSKDNSTLNKKIALRRMALEFLQYELPRRDSRFSLLDVDVPIPVDPAEPVVMETHGGYGRIYLACYHAIRRGVVFETDEKKVLALSEQRQRWAVYQSDCEKAIRAGAGSHLPVNLLDVDPYGSPWPVIEAFFKSDRPHPEKLVVVVNDGLRRNVRFGMSWHVDALTPLVEQFGNDLFKCYLEACQLLMQTIAAQAGYRLDRFSGYYCGEKENMTHYLAVLINDAAPPASGCNSLPAGTAASPS